MGDEAQQARDGLAPGSASPEARSALGPIDDGDGRSDELRAEDRPQTATTSDNAPTTTAAADDADVPENGARDVHQSAEALFNLLGGNAVIYYSAEGARRPATGRIDEAMVIDALSVFAVPPAFDEAKAVLAKHGFVVLVGVEASGRYTASLALLAGWPQPQLPAPVLSFVPTTSLGELARNVEEASSGCGGYLLHDFRGDDRPSAEQRFNVTRLRDLLSQAGARLVITADPSALAKADFRGLMITWSPPDGGAVFDAHHARCGVDLTPDEMARARAHAVELGSPQLVAVFVAQISVVGLDQAMHSQAESDRAAVRDWFEEPSRTLEEELAVAAACFLHEVPERIFERCLSRLHELVRKYDQDERAPLDKPLTLGRSRELWAGGGGLLSTTDGVGQFVERRVCFRSRYMRQPALHEVWDRYGFGLLQPMREWIGQLVADTSLAVRAQTVVGLALLAERRWPEVRDTFLERWSDGDFPHRLAAAFVLGVMADSEMLAPVALETALDWSDKGGPRRASTAALTLGGPLGLRYQDRSFEELWFLTRRARGIRASASIGLSIMLAWAAHAVHDGDEDEVPTEAEEAASLRRALGVLQTTCRAVAWTTRRERALERRYALDAVVAMLGVSRFVSDELAIVAVLRAEAAAIEVIGELLAAVLESGPHHHASVDVLRELLQQLSERVESQALAHQLGVAVFRRWPAQTQSVIIPQIARELSEPTDDGIGFSLAGLQPGRGRGTGGGLVTPEVTRRVIRSFVESLGQF